jgi:hypothetical protein
MNLKLKTMKKQYLTFGLVALFGCSLLVVSCNKDENAQLSNSSALTVAEDDANSDNLFDDVYSEMDETVTDLETEKYEVTSSILKSAAVEGSKTITVSTPDTVNFPKTITIQYSNWTDMAGRVKNGTIIIVITGKYRTIGASKTVTFQNFTIDSVLIEGTHTVENLGRNASGYLQYRFRDLVVCDGWRKLSVLNGLDWQ